MYTAIVQHINKQTRTSLLFPGEREGAGSSFLNDLYSQAKLGMYSTEKHSPKSIYYLTY